MKITYLKPKYYEKEVTSKEYDEALAILENLCRIGYIDRIDKNYSETGWELKGIRNKYDPYCGCLYHGEWEEHLSEPREIKSSEYYNYHKPTKRYVDIFNNETEYVDFSEFVEGLK